MVIRRFIPTCVGNTPGTEPTMTLMTVHPHVRGEHNMIMAKVNAPLGSSPRAWGTPPAPNESRGAFTVHPHVRGEHSSEKLLISRFNFDVKERTD